MECSLKMGWIFTKTEIKNSPSVVYGMDKDEEMLNRQEAALFIDKMGFTLGLTNLCVITAIIIMNRFYMCHPLIYFPWNSVCSAAVLLASKLEEDRRPVEYITSIANYYLLYTNYDSQNQHELLQIEEVKQSEEIILSTLGFDLDALETSTPSRIVLMLCEEIEVPRNVAQISYLLASCTVFCTTLVLQYRPNVIACFCLYQACKWTDWKIKKKYNTHEWYYSIDNAVNRYILEQIILEFQNQYKTCPKELKQKFIIITRFINDDIVQRIIKPPPHLFYPEFTKPTVKFDFESIFNEVGQDTQLLQSSVKQEEKIKKPNPMVCTTNKMNSKDKKSDKAVRPEYQGKENRAKPYIPYKKKDKNTDKK